MRRCYPFCLTLLIASAAIAQSGPTDPKAQKPYAEAQDFLKHHQNMWALEGFKKAAKQDGHCIACEKQVINLGLEMDDYKAAMSAAQHIITLVHSQSGVAAAHYLFGTALLHAGSAKHKDDLLNQSEQEFKAALETDPTLQPGHFWRGHGARLAQPG